MLDTPFFKTGCPSYGAPVEARPTSAVALVYGYYNSMLVQQDGGIVDPSRDSALLEDFSPLQTDTTDTFVTQRFTLVGRLQIQYDDGVWNEWYTLFADGRTGWLSEAGNLYVTAIPVETGSPPRFKDIRAGFSELTFQNKRYIASDMRHINLKRTAAQGELLFALNEDSQNKVADWRCEDLFITLGYSDKTPETFFGRIANLDDSKLENTRSEDEIKESVSRLKGSIASENCPGCGSPVHWVSDLTPHLSCTSYGGELAIGKDRAKLITINAMRTAQRSLFALPVGRQGRLKNHELYIMDAARYAETDTRETFENLFNGLNHTLTPGGQWSEYLLYNPTQGFLWLVEPDDGWNLSQTRNTQPRLDHNRQPQDCGKLYDYGDRIEVTADASYWRIRSGDLNYYNDCRDGQNRKLCAELNAHEMAWNKSVPVAYSGIAETLNLSSCVPRCTVSMTEDVVDNKLRLLVIGIPIIVNIPAFLVSDGNHLTIIITLFFAGYAIWVIGREKGKEED